MSAHFIKLKCPVALKSPVIYVWSSFLFTHSYPSIVILSLQNCTIYFKARSLWPQLKLPGKECNLGISYFGCMHENNRGQTMDVSPEPTFWQASRDDPCSISWSWHLPVLLSCLNFESCYHQCDKRPRHCKCLGRGPVWHICLQYFIHNCAVLCLSHQCTCETVGRRLLRIKA